MNSAAVNFQPSESPVINETDKMKSRNNGCCFSEGTICVHCTTQIGLDD